MDIVRIFDTTLRDGEQSPGFSMSVAEKLRMARQLESQDGGAAIVAVTSADNGESRSAIAVSLARAASKMGKKAILFVMTDDTRNCDDVGAYLEKICPELEGAVLVIHTKNNGEISEAASGKNREELEKLRREANQIDSWKSPFKAIVSVLVLKEGWDVRNVTTIVGLRAYVAQSNILPDGDAAPTTGASG